MAQKTMYPAQISSPGTELAAAATAAATEITLLDALKLPDAPNLATIGSDETAEVILYTGKTGNKLTGVTRGFQGAAKSWSVGARVARYFTAADHDTFISNIKDLDERVNNIKIPDASDEVAGIVRTNSATNSEAKDEAATPFAVNLVMQAATEAAGRADAAFTSASEGKSRVRTVITGAKGTVQVADPTVGPTFDELATGAGTILAGATADATATASDMAADKTAYKNGQKIVGAVPVQNTTSITANGSRPAGIYPAFSVAVPTNAPVAGTTKVINLYGSGYSSLSTSYQKVTNSIKVLIAGRYRVSVDASSNNSMDYSNIQFRKGGGTILYTSPNLGSTYATYALNFDLLENDVVELWMKTGGGGYVYAKDFYLGITPLTYAVTT